MVDENTIITLEDGKRYSIAFQMGYESTNYLYLVNMDDIADYKIGRIENADFIEVKEEKLLNDLIIKFAELASESNN